VTAIPNDQAAPHPPCRLSLGFDVADKGEVGVIMRCPDVFQIMAELAPIAGARSRGVDTELGALSLLDEQMG
jgi:hypothetical protein